MFKLVLLISLSILFVAVPTKGQGKDCPSHSKSQNIQTARTLTPCDIEMKEVDLVSFRLMIPSVLEQKVEKDGRKCIEGGCFEFTGGGMTLYVDKSAYAFHPTFERQYPSYVEESAVVDNVPAKFWSFEEKGTLITGANYWNKDGKQIGLGINLQSVTTDIREIAKKIFTSVKFTPKSK